MPTQCLQKVRSRSNRCPCNKFHFREKIFRESTSCPEAPTGRPHKSHGTGFPHISRPWKEKALLAWWNSCSLTGRQYLFQLPLSFLWLVKAQGFSCCKALGEQANLPHHDTNMRPTGIEPWPILQKGLLYCKSPMYTLSQNGYGANPVPSKGTLKIQSLPMQ